MTLRYGDCGGRIRRLSEDDTVEVPAVEEVGGVASTRDVVDEIRNVLCAVFVAAGSDDPAVADLVERRAHRAAALLEVVIRRIVREAIRDARRP